MGMVVQTIKGGGWSFFGGHGTLISKELTKEEEIVIDTNSVIAMADSVTVDIRCVGNCGMVCCSGEGITYTVLVGPGLIVLQSLPLAKLRRIIMEWIRAHKQHYILLTCCKALIKIAMNSAGGGGD